MKGPIPGVRLRPAIWGTVMISLVLIAGMVLVRSLGSASSGRTYVVFLVNVILVVSIQAFIGNSGVVSFGHVAFMGIGAYTTALVTIPEAVKSSLLPDLPSVLANTTLGLLPAIALSALVAVVVAAVFGGGMIRMTESTMAMATLALLVVTHTFLQNATTFTRGSLGLAGIPVRTTIGVATVAAIAFVFLGRLYKESGPGLHLRATREDPLSAASVGINVVLTRYAGWLLSAAMMGAAGSLWAQSVIAFNANQFYFAITFALLGMLVIGGRTSLSGAVAGAAIITFMTDTLARVEQGVSIGPWELPRITGTVQFAIALLIIVTLILRPEGIFDRWEVDDLARRLIPSGRRARRTRQAEAAEHAAPDVAEVARTASDTVLLGEGVAKHFEGVAALGGVDIEVRDGEILGLIGPNGSGKTTLLNVVSGVYTPSGGRIVFDDRDTTGRKPHQIARLGLSRTFQNIRLFSQLTVCENVEAAAPPGADETSVDEVLAWFGLETVEREKATNLPYGMQRRLEIARAVVRRPSLILLDEPAAGMNEAESDGLLENIKRIRIRLGCAIVVVDHDLRLIMKLCDRIQVLDQGRTIALGLPRQIAEDPAVIEAYLGGPSTKSA
ncbi:MAG TPA: branched-chain amino acid ABC transporter ATP-binding protein/permease [Actinomycetota bacterium]|nr:branched-chain amino acid ABC transporter ATP-binding protein/permease [Actinomycetota bacterium]